MLELLHIPNGKTYQTILDEDCFCQRLLFFKTGTVTIILKGLEYRIEGPAMVNHSPFAELRLVEANIEDSSMLSFNGHSMDKLISHAFQILCPMTGVFQMKLRPIDFSIIEGILNMMTESLLEPDILELQATLLAKYLERFHDGSNSRHFAEHDIVRRFVAFVDNEHESAHEISHYAQKLGVSTRTLNRVFRDNTGITPKASLKYRLNLAAKNQLLEKRKSVKEISYQLGFSSPEYFHSFFYKTNGLTPKEYVRISESK